MAQNQRPLAETLSGSPQPNFIGYQPSPIISKRDPTSGDTGYNFGQVWINKVSNQYWGLTSVAAGLANWLILGSGTGAVDKLTGDTGPAVTPVGGNINIFGSPDIR